MTAAREQEVMYMYWSNVNFWTAWAYKEREIPIPAKIVKKLKAWKAESDKTCNLRFPTSGCNPKLDFLN